MKVGNSILSLLAALGVPAFATVTINYVTIGNPGNAADPSTGYGAVPYEFQIGKHEVTNSQYLQFLNAKGASNSNGIYNPNMALYGLTQSGEIGNYTYSLDESRANRPVVYVSWFDAARFANWISNGQGNSDMETGAYTLNGATSGIIHANPGARIYIPTEDEWYKAAYYNPNTSSYSLYPNGKNVISTSEASYGPTIGTMTDVGAYWYAPSSYGTFDQGGNAYEWNDAFDIYGARGLRGGSIYPAGKDQLASSWRSISLGGDEYSYVGFRVASLAAIPEPGSLCSTAALLGCGILLRRRKH